MNTSIHTRQFPHFYIDGDTFIFTGNPVARTIMKSMQRMRNRQKEVCDEGQNELPPERTQQMKAENNES
jgi:hypothetical protein